MPPKRKAVAAKKGAGGKKAKAAPSAAAGKATKAKRGKKVEEEDEEEEQEPEVVKPATKITKSTRGKKKSTVEEDEEQEEEVKPAAKGKKGKGCKNTVAVAEEEEDEEEDETEAPSTAKKMAAAKGKKGKGCKNTVAVAEEEEDEEEDETEAPSTAKKMAAAKGKKGKGGKKTVAEEEEDEEEEETEAPSTAKKMAEALKKAGASSKKKTYKVDSYCRLANCAQVYQDYDCMLNQTNIGHNNNKYYVIQLLEYGTGSGYYIWTRWGRVGEPGANDLKGPFNPLQLANVKTIFKKKYQDKTKNKWEDRENFKAVPGKYTLLEMGDDEDETDSATTAAAPSATDCLPCTLDPPTQALIKLIFDNNMFQDALKHLEIDTSKMPLGKISKMQIAKGFEALEKIEAALKNKQTSKLAELSSQFYTVIPHNFGRSLPQVINNDELLRKKLDMLTILADIELAQAMQKEVPDEKQKKAGKSPHPLDVQYGLLQCGLNLMKQESGVFKILEKYMHATESYRKLKILDVWEVDRSSEGARYAANDSIGNRKLLWHGTNVAVVAAILKSGLRIMPHSGGRVGRGIYFASENDKSAGYVQTAAGGIGIMFLNEVALGKERHIDKDNYSLTKPPAGFDSIVAKGRTEPDPKFDTKIKLDGHDVVVPQGKPIPQSDFQNSYFSQSEYLIYREDQCRIRYLLKLKF